MIKNYFTFYRIFYRPKIFLPILLLREEMVYSLPLCTLLECFTHFMLLQLLHKSKIRLFNLINCWKLKSDFLSVNGTISRKLPYFEYGKFQMFKRQMNKPLHIKHGNTVFNHGLDFKEPNVNETKTYILLKCYPCLKTL